MNGLIGYGGIENHSLLLRFFTNGTNLVLSGNIDKVYLDSLEELTGNLTITGSTLDTFLVPKMIRLGQLNVLSNTDLSSLNFPELESNQYDLSITNYSNLSAVSFPMLHSVDRDVTLGGLKS